MNNSAEISLSINLTFCKVYPVWTICQPKFASLNQEISTAPEPELQDVDNDVYSDKDYSDKEQKSIKNLSVFYYLKLPLLMAENLVKG